ncbi:MAG: efflux RND transporter periplasmic adaptor subunit, partial [Alphaproteobacteria bacterium]|nr:efflux RND transporter periplasmic adaptor subunit [Alphaproteobacteria bacterium]
KPGMTATAEIDAADLHNVLAVPNTALRFVPPDDIKAKAPTPPPAQAGITWGRVWIRDGDNIVPHDIRLGATDGRSSVVVGGDVKPGDEAVTEIKGKPWQPKPSSSFGP